MPAASRIRTVAAASILALLAGAIPSGATLAQATGKTAHQEFLEILDKLLQGAKEGSSQEFRAKYQAAIEQYRHQRPPPIPETARRAMIEGNTAFARARERSDVREARQLFMAAVERAPWWAGPYFNLGLTYMQLHEYERAADCFYLYLEAAPHAGDVASVRQKIYEAEYLMERQHRAMKLIAEGRGHRSGQRSTAAIHAYEEALRLDPDNAEAHSLLGAALASARPVDAMLHLRKAVRLGEMSAFTYNWLGVAHYEAGDREEALALFFQAKDASGGDSDPYVAYNIGITHYNLDNYRDSIPHFEQALQLGYHDPAKVQRFLAYARPRAVPCVDAKGMRAFSYYLNQRIGKAFAIAPDGAWGYRTSDQESARAVARAAVSNCQQHTGTSCALYAEGNNVVLPRSFSCQGD